MEKLAHYLEIRTFQYPTEDSKKVKKALSQILGLGKKELEEELSKDKMETQFDQEIIKYSMKIDRWRKIKEIIQKIFKNNSTPENLFKHLNDEGDFYIRLDKQSAYRGNIKPVENGDVIHIKTKIASYPFNMDQVKQNLKKLIGEEDD